MTSSVAELKLLVERLGKTFGDGTEATPPDQALTSEESVQIMYAACDLLHIARRPLLIDCRSDDEQTHVDTELDGAIDTIVTLAHSQAVLAGIEEGCPGWDSEDE